MSSERVYEILGMIGSGGFGDVYRARLHAGDFSKEVAIKVLNDPDPPEDVLQRFRDEARILGLVRDRAIVSVDPPTKLSGRWAVVMDFVDGVNAVRALRALGPLPPGVALEIVAEVSRVLDKMHRTKGPDGTPLGLLHRDLKPGNIQITPTGEIRLLDFGTARAQFDGRESQTTSAVMGTPGYIAPERLLGVDLPSGDVYSLGVTLWVLVTGESPNLVRSAKLDEAIEERAPEEGALRQTLQLAAAMRHLDENARPTHAEVEERALELRRSLPAPWLRDWAKKLPSSSSEGSDLVGERLIEGDPGVSRVTGSGLTTQRLALVGGGLFTSGVLTLIAVVVLTLLIAVLVWQSQGGDDVELPSTAVAAEPTPRPVVPEPIAPVESDAPAPTDPAQEGLSDAEIEALLALGAEPTDAPAADGTDTDGASVEAASEGTDAATEGDGATTGPSAPTPPSSARTGTLQLTRKSDVHEVWAVLDGQRYELGELPAGVYRLSGRFTSAPDSTFTAGPFVVRQGKTTRVHCDALAWRCVVR